MLEADGADRLRAGLLCAAALAALALGHASRVEQQPGGLRGADVKVECAVGADGDADGQWGAGCEVCGASVEFLGVLAV